MSQETLDQPSGSAGEENKEPKTEESKETPKGRRICAWCQKDSGPAETEGDSHGICSECKAQHFPKEHY